MGKKELGKQLDLDLRDGLAPAVKTCRLWQAGEERLGNDLERDSSRLIVRDAKDTATDDAVLLPFADNEATGKSSACVINSPAELSGGFLKEKGFAELQLSEGIDRTSTATNGRHGNILVDLDAHIPRPPPPPPRPHAFASLRLIERPAHASAKSDMPISKGVAGRALGQARPDTPRRPEADAEPERDGSKP